MLNNYLIDQVKNNLITNFYPERIILFGSQARGTANKHSDIDLMIISRYSGNRRTLIGKMYESVREFKLPIEFVLLTPEEFNTDRYIPGTIARPAWKEGKVLYEH